jgi:hypothetical protein
LTEGTADDTQTAQFSDSQAITIGIFSQNMPTTNTTIKARCGGIPSRKETRDVFLLMRGQSLLTAQHHLSKCY